MLEARELEFSHNGQERYSFTFEAPPGEVTAISGSSGSGKSTLLDLVAGFLEPRGGTLRLEGRDLLPLEPEERPVSILFQSESLFEHLSAERNVALGLASKTARQARATAVAEALGGVGLPGVGRQKAGQLSGGQKQRVALARTLLRNRPILLLDEPFSALDDEARIAIRALVLRLTREKGWATLLVSHNRDDVEAVATRRYRLEEGRLVEA